MLTSTARALRRAIRPRAMRTSGAFLLTLLLGAALAAPAAAQSRVPVLGQIQVVGTQTVRAEQVVAWSGLQVGEAISREIIAQAIRELYATGKFRDVFVYETRPRPGVLELVLNLTEYPRLASVRFDGNDEIDDDDLSDVVELRVGNFLAPSAIRTAIDAVRDKYRAEGYYRAEIDVDRSLLQLAGNQPLVFVITENPKVQVRRILIEGNEALEDGELRDAMSTKVDNWWRSGTFKLPEFEADLEKIVQRYGDAGYLDAVVRDHEIEFLEDEENHIEIRIFVDEGPQFRVGEIGFDGNEVFPTERLESLVVLETGDVFRAEDFQESQRNVQSLYWDDGYIYSTLSPQRNRRDGNVIDVDFVVREGEQAKIRRVVIQGNDKTREEVLRRQLRILPGDLFSNEELRNSQGDLFRLGFFEDVQVDFEQTPVPEQIDLIFDVKEKQTGQFTMGVGFSAETEASGFFNIGENNFLGRAQSLQFAWQFGSRRNFLNLSFTEPWAFGTPTLLGVDVYSRYSNRVRDFYETKVRGFALRVGRPVPKTRFTTASIRYSLSETELRNFDQSYSDFFDDLEREVGSRGLEFQRLDERDWPELESQITMSVVRNSQNNPFFPTAGSRALARVELSGGPLGGDVDYTRVTSDYDWYTALPWKLAFHAGVSSGFITSAAPDYVRFRLGGNRTYQLRGYQDIEVVPRDNLAAGLRFVGGRFYTTFTSEVAYQLTSAVHFLAFVDQGDTWNSFEEADVTNLRTGAGFGVRLEVPLVGRIGLDYGYGFDKGGLGDDPGWTAHFNFGQFF